MSKKKKDTLQNIIIFLSIALIAFFIVFFITKASNQNTYMYNDVIFDKTFVGNITFYHTTFPIYGTQDVQVATYNEYLRTSPEDLKNVPFTGELLLFNQVVLNTTENFHCDGRGIISLANLADLYGILGISLINNQSIGCSPGNNYNFYQITSGDTTEIVETQQGCYELRINNCEILEVTEKMMVEVLSQIQQKGTKIYLQE